MIATTLTEAVSQIIGKPASEEFAKEYVLNNYMEFRMFTRHEDSLMNLVKEIEVKQSKAKSFGTFGTFGNRIKGLKR